MKHFLTRRNYITIAVMMLVLFVLFQFSLVMKDYGNRYDENEFISKTSRPASQPWKPEICSVEEKVPKGEYVVFIGKADSSVYDTVEQWCTYSKRNLMLCADPPEYRRQEEHLPAAILIDGAAIDVDKDMRKLKEMSEEDVPLIFCTIPDAHTVKENPDLMSLLGIDEVKAERVDIVGVHIFSGFVLGGESIYQVNSKEDRKRMDLELSVPWYHTFNGVKSYMIGMFEKQPEKTDMQPSLLWRYSNGNNMIFVVNTDLIRDASAVGYLEAMMAELYPYDIYPVVNAQLISVVNVPGLSEENTARVQKIYGRGLESLYQDIIWPNLVALSNRSRFSMTCFLNPRIGDEVQEKVSENQIRFYLMQMKELGAEAGISMKGHGNRKLSERIKTNQKFIENAGNGYSYSAVYVGKGDSTPFTLGLSEAPFEGMQTIVTDPAENIPVISYSEKGDFTLQKTTVDAADYRFSDDLKLKGYETALGYSNVLLDVTDTIWPKTHEDEWQEMSQEVSANIDTYWKPFSGFDKLTATEADRRIRAFLALSYEEERIGGKIQVSVRNFRDDAYFILRTHGEKVEKVRGGSFVELEEGAYLIRAAEEELTVEVVQAENHVYTE